MKNLITCFFMFWVISLLSQNKEVLYGLEETPQGMILNPGSRISYDYHFGVPFISQIHFNGGSSGVSVYDILGKKVMAASIPSSILNISELKSGVYTLKIIQNEISSTKKLVIK